MAKDSPKTPKTSSRGSGNPSISIWAVQCGKCFKWRKVSTQEEFEEIRSKFNEEPFHCENKPNVTCDDPAEIEYDSSRTWAIDKPNEPKTPIGFKRELCLRSDYSKMDVYYITPSGKKLRSTNEVGTFLQQNPEFSDLSTKNFSFKSPKIMDDTIPFSSTK
ncbi:methyl-CpG-binding domain-containing protein 4-like [Lycium barbarum]|uniref:methyl-CpG-binding domain-containing protein 4-like n=1 Tax=Lycium ferocissimum TaxID=112874 RepID=UPI002815E2C4|nr:methyl-CpG-binding domain-containing protein 4-like [Lycium ferocissimum]XP_060178280.1 methyl-CpG-binding domain-containing protein 4-like [Lycium barbarum]